MRFRQPTILKLEDDGFISWDFREADTKELTHCIHTYPAMMIPQVARRLINLYGKNAKTILDPFMGSGTSLVEATINPSIKKAYGLDLNPLAVLISKVKTTPIKIDNLNKTLNQIINSKRYKELPNFKNIEFWFKPEVIKELAILKNSIGKIDNKDIRDFFLVVFSETVRNVSNTRKGEFKLYRIKKEDIKEHNPNVLDEFKKIAKRYIKGMQGYNEEIKQKPELNYFLWDTMKDLPIPENSVDLIVTSPPYGDSRTTVAYGQFSRLALQWLDYKNANVLDKNLLGGIPSKNIGVYIDSPTLIRTINKISSNDEKRAKEVLSFFEDFDKCIIQIDKVIANGGYVCFVVGNRTVKDINIPTDKIMIEMFLATGNYQYITTHLRDIPFKRMPKMNSPSNIKGENGKTMTKEFIFVLQKI